MSRGHAVRLRNGMSTLAFLSAPLGKPQQNVTPETNSLGHYPGQVGRRNSPAINRATAHIHNAIGDKYDS